MLIKIDAKQLEWRVAVWLSMDPLGIEELNSGIDIHENNKVAFSLPTRLIAKTYLFRTIFRGSGWAFANDPEFKHVSSSADFWDGVNEKFYKKYRGLDKCHNVWADLTARGKPIISPLGREWLIPRNLDGSLPWTVFTNHPVQGTGADIVMLARISLYRRLLRNGLRSLIVSTVHDDIKVDAPDDEVDQVVQLAYEVFDDIPKNIKKIFGITVPIEFPGEVYVGKNLLNMEEVKR